MADLFDSGRIVEWILVLMALEAVLLIAVVRWRRRRSNERRSSDRTLPLAGLLLNLAAGAALLLALRTVLVGADWRIAGAWLAAALVAHLGDLVLRLRR